MAFANFDELPDDLRRIVVQEFVKIVEMDAFDDAMKIFVGPAWDQRELILSQMDQVPLRQREPCRALTAAGYDVLVPGMSPTSSTVSGSWLAARLELS